MRFYSYTNARFYRLFPSRAPHIRGLWLVEVCNA